MKSFLFFVFGGILGAVAGGGGMLLAFPFIFPPAQVNESVQGYGEAALLGESHFRKDSPGQDAGHWGRGGIKFYRAADGSVLAELQEDFEVGPGPNFWIYLNSVKNIETEKDFLADGARIKIHKIKSFSGAQVYKLDGEEFSGSRALTVWCESFNQYIASADLPELTG